MFNIVTPALRYSDVDRQNSDGATYTPVGTVQEPFCLVIANPPYVRTQIMGAQKV